MNLLRKMPFDGYPSLYLQARILGRGAARTIDCQALLAKGVPPGTSEGALRSALCGEFLWLYSQMNVPLRKTFAPVFAFFELRTLVLCLRSKGARAREAVDTLLAQSLLAAEVQQILRGELELSPTVVALTEYLASVSEAFGPLDDIYRQQGFKAYENGLMRVYLEQTVKEKLHPFIRDFMIQIIDLRNILALCKQLRWEVTSRAPFIEGGSVSKGKLEELLEQGELSGVEPLLGKWPETAGAVSTGPLETGILRRITLRLRPTTRDADGIRQLLGYLWQRYIDARNLRVLLLGRGLGEEVLAAELIL